MVTLLLHDNDVEWSWWQVAIRLIAMLHAIRMCERIDYLRIMQIQFYWLNRAIDQSLCITISQRCSIGHTTDPENVTINGHYTITFVWGK